MSLTEIEPHMPPQAPPAAEASATIDLTDQATQSPGRPTFTITDAASACAVSRKTITRKLGDLALHGAAKDEDGIWRIPVEALIAVGLHPGRSLPSVHATRRPDPVATTASAPAPPSAASPSEGDVVTVPRHRWDDLRIRLARAEAEAAERALALADARLALRALTAGPAVREPSPTYPALDAAPRVGSTPTASQESQVVARAPGPISLSVTTPPAAGPGGEQVRPGPAAQDPTAQMAAARQHAAQNGGYVPAAPAAPTRKRRWWQSK